MIFILALHLLLLWSGNNDKFIKENKWRRRKKHFCVIDKGGFDVE